MQKYTLQAGFLVVAVLALFSVFCFAQDTATLTGTVPDNTGALIPGAVVNVQNVATGLVHQLQANSAGESVGAALLAGQYGISVAVKGFRACEAKGVVLRVAQNARIDIALQVGSTHEEVTFHGEGLAQVNTESSELGGTITGK